MRNWKRKNGEVYALYAKHLDGQDRERKKKKEEVMTAKERKKELYKFAAKTIYSMLAEMFGTKTKKKGAEEAKDNKLAMSLKTTLDVSAEELNFKNLKNNWKSRVFLFLKMQQSIDREQKSRDKEEKNKEMDVDQEEEEEDKIEEEEKDKMKVETEDQPQQKKAKKKKKKKKWSNPGDEVQKEEVNAAKKKRRETRKILKA